MKITSFGDYTFPLYDTEDTIPADARQALTVLAGADGAYDSHQRNGPQAPVVITKKFTLIPGSFAGIDTALDSIRKVAGRGQQLLKIQMRDDSYRQVWAKIISVRHPQTPEHHSFLPVEISFQVAFPAWEAAADRSYLGIHAGALGSGTLGDNYTERTVSASPDTFTITYNGTKRFTGGELVAEATGTTTNPRLTNLTNDYYMQWTGALSAGDRLHIFLSTGRVLQNGSAPTYALSRGSNQTVLMALEFGANSMQFEVDDVSPNCKLRYYWAKWYM